MDLWPHTLALGAAAALLSYAGIGVFLRWAARREILDLPNERSSHDRPVPRGGGVPIVVVTLPLLSCAWLVDPEYPGITLAAFLALAGLLALLGWLDDLHTISARVRLMVQLGVALLAIACFGYWQLVEIPPWGTWTLGYAGIPLAILWIVGLTNAYNFMDGIDGLAAVQAIVTGTGWAFLAHGTPMPMVGVLSVLIVGASLGFLVHNRPPARIFLGDVGSVFLGFSLAVMTVIAGNGHPELIVPGVLLIFPFVFDTVFTFFRRLFRGENIFSAHRSHLYQRLVQAGHSHGRVTWLYSGYALITALCAVVWLELKGIYSVAVLLVPALISFSLWRFVLAQERREASRED